MKIKHDPTKSYKETAQIHADADKADKACGRKWCCACGACRIARQEKFKPKESK